MRLNRGTLVLLAVLLLVIVGVLVINNQQANAPGDATGTPSTVSGPLLPNVAAENIVRYEIRDNNTGAFTAVTKDAGGAWVIDATNAIEGRAPEQSLIDTTAGQIIAINYNSTFEDDQLASFGLDQPDYTVLISTTGGELYTVYIGAKVPTGPRYYAVMEQSTFTPDATMEPGAVATQNIADENPNEEGVAPTSEATAEVTDAESTDAASKPVPHAQATDEATDEVIATEEATDESAATDEATAEATAELTAAATSDVIAAPAVTLSGSKTIYLIPQTVIDTLKRWLATPPYAPIPTPEPADAATEAAVPDASTAEAIGVQGTIQPPVVLEEGGNTELIPEGTLVATQEVTEAP
jgi:hypothetical protein